MAEMKTLLPGKCERVQARKSARMIEECHRVAEWESGRAKERQGERVKGRESGRVERVKE